MKTTLNKTLSAILLAIAALPGAQAAAPSLPAAVAPGLNAGEGVPALPPLPGLSAGTAAGSAGESTPKVSITNGKADVGTERAATPRVVAPVVSAAPTEFENLVRESVGKPLPVFGKELFRGATADVTSVPAAADYLVGPGDELVIKAWGGVEIDYRATVGADGNVYIPKVGNVFIAGTRFSESRQVVGNAIRKNFRNFELAVSLGQMRSTDVKVVGMVGRAGTYQLSAYATILDALTAAGGPASHGTFRNVTVVRKGKPVQALDVYDVLLKGDKTADVRLQPGDVVVVSNSGVQVAIAGAVSREAIFEMKKGETLAQLLDYAGGYSVTARPKQLRVERVSPTTFKREVLELSGDQVASFELRDGDIIRIPRITGEISNAVTLRGSVAEPMRLAWKDGFRVSDLITSKDMLIEAAYWKNRNEAVHQDVAAGGEEALRLRVKRSFDEINWDYAVVERLDRDNLQAQLIPFNLGKALAGDERENLKLLPGDIVTVFSKQDVKVSVARQNRFVRLEGEVMQPGVYLATPTDTVQSLVAKAGGLTSYAYLYGAEFKRESTKRQQQARMKDILERLQTNIESAARQRATDALSGDDVRLNQAEAENDKRLVERLKRVEATGRVVLGIPVDANTANKLPELTFEDGDVLTIPAKPSTVSVAGSVFNENAFMYAPGKTVAQYVEQAGGPMAPSASNLYYIAKADGSVVPASRGDSLNPGDTVLVMEEVGKKSLVRSLRDWTQIIYQLGLGAAGIHMLKD